MPVAVVKMPTKGQIAKAASGMGAIYSLDGVYTLEELGLEAFPLTRTGKVRKDELRKAVLRKQVAPSMDSPPQKPPHQVQDTVATPPQSPAVVANQAAPSDSLDLVTELSSIVSDLVGTNASPDTDLRTMMDSVSMLRYADRVLRRLGRRLYLQDVTKAPTIAEQAALLQSRGNSTILETRTDDSIPGGQPAEAWKGEEVFPTGSVAEEAGALQALGQLGLDMSDVETVIPVRAGYRRFALAERPQTYRHRTIFSVQGATAAKVRQAVEMGLASRPLLRSILGQDADKYLWHVGIRAPAILPHMMETVEVSDDAASEELNQDDSAAAFHPALGTQIKIVSVRDSGKVNLILTYSHAVFDVLSIRPFHSDLDCLISMADPSPAVLTPSIPFKFFTDLYHDYTDSVPAKLSVRAMAHRLRGISKAKWALWPRQRAPGWFVGSDAAATRVVRERRAEVREQVWAQSGRPWTELTAQELRFPRAARVVNLPSLQKLRTEKGIEAQTVAVAALAAFNALKTGESYAVFNTVDHGRAWPFVPAWIESGLPSAMSIDGPTAEWVLNMVRVDRRGEEVGQFLTRMQREQSLSSKHAHAPWDKVVEALGPEEAAFAQDAARRQTFVWDVTLQMLRGPNEYTSLKAEARYDWPDCGWYWNCCTVDQDNLLVVASWDTAQMNDQEVQQCCDEYAHALRAVARWENWDTNLADALVS